eukprot:TRINITY_DN12982_c0_g1_i1.p1 TRINITY_DN12982_c0_g1~~TRINITY_DN12982_c0_g1_i1.p1  ORF type:complete len:541 (-),score=172.47 TRINITY_DN12982_c0_g1_i1:48-1670(-)
MGLIVRSSRPLRDFAFLDLEGNIFTTGCPIYGVAALVLQKELSGLKSIYLKWEGKEQAMWTKPNGELCSAERIVFSTYQSLWKPSSEVDDRILNSGSHHWPFEWNLPSAVPSSFIDTNPEGTTVAKFAPQLFSAYGHIPHKLYGEKPNITYKVSLVVETDDPADSATLKCSRCFIVTQRLDLDIVRIEPLSKSVERSYLFSKGHLQLKVTLPYGAVAFRGRSLPLRVEITNEPKKKLETITMTVHQSLIFNAKGEMLQKKISSFMGTTTANEESNSEPPSFLVRDLLLNVPLETEPSITLGTLIQRHYELTVELSVFMGTSATVSLPIQLFDPHELDSAVLSHFPTSGSQEKSENLSSAPEAIKGDGLNGGDTLDEEFNATDENSMKRKKEEKQRKLMLLLARTPESSPKNSMKKSPSYDSLERGQTSVDGGIKPRLLASSEPQHNPIHNDHEDVKLSNAKLRAALELPQLGRRKHSRAASLQISHDHSVDFLNEMKKEKPEAKPKNEESSKPAENKKEEIHIPELVLTKPPDNLEEITL